MHTAFTVQHYRQQRPPFPVDDNASALAKQITKTFNPDVSRLACLEFTIRHFGHCPSGWPAQIRETLIALRQECLDAWMAARQITAVDVEAAIQALQRAQTTMAYIDSLPV